MSRKANYEAIVDGKWHWCPADYDTDLQAGVNELSVVMQASEPGRRPPRDHLRLFVQYETTESGITYLGSDIYASQGQLTVAREVVPAVITSWPSPDFMGSNDAARFIRAWTPSEIEAGHFHMPIFYILESDTVSKLRAEQSNG